MCAFSVGREVARRRENETMTRRDRSVSSHVDGQRHVACHALMESFEPRLMLSGMLWGSVWDDANGDGVRDPGDAGIDGVTVQLLSDPGGTVVATGQTITMDLNENDVHELDEVGILLFVDVPPGTYLVRPVLDAASQATTAESISVEIIDSEEIHDLDFGSFATSTISGSRWHDLDEQGDRDSGEPGIEGWVIELVDSSTSAVVDTAITAADGAYQFVNVGAGSYDVRSQPRDGWTDTHPSSGVHVATISSGQALDDLDFGGYKRGAIRGTVWQDADGDGVQDEGEDALSGWVVQLDGTALEATTNESGQYEFLDLVSGSYSVSLQLPAEWEVVSPEFGVYTLDVVNGDLTGKDFGCDCAKMEISGVLWHDVNADGIRDAGDDGENGVTVELVDTSTDLIAYVATTEDADVDGQTVSGYYSFTVPAGSYKVRTETRSGWVQTSPASEYSASYEEYDTLYGDNPRDFTFATSVSPVGAVTLKLSTIGDLDSFSEYVTVFADDTELATFYNAHTGQDGTGKYYTLATETITISNADIISMLADGEVVVRVEPSAGVSEGADKQEFIEVELTFGGNGSQLVDGAPGEIIADMDFGSHKESAKVEGIVWKDFNGDGEHDSGDVGIDGMTVELIDHETQAVLDTSTTQSVEIDGEIVFGYYSFDVADGTYDINVVVQPDWVLTSPSLNYNSTLAESGTIYYHPAGDNPVFDFLDASQPASDATLTIAVTADLGDTNEYLMVYAEGTRIEIMFNMDDLNAGIQGVQSPDPSPVRTITIPQTMLADLADDGTVSITIQPSLAVGSLAAGTSDISLELGYVGTGRRKVTVDAGETLSDVDFGMSPPGTVNGVPTLSTISTLSGATEDTPYTITYESLAVAANESDPDGQSVTFSVQSVPGGTVKKDGQDVIPGMTLLGPGESLEWTPLKDSNGVQGAFYVKAWDGIDGSAMGVLVAVDVAAVNDAPHLVNISPFQGTGLIPYTISYDNLISHSGVTDAEVDPIHFVVTAVNSGVTKDGTDLAIGDTLSAGESFVWTPGPADGEYDMFSVAASDGSAQSASVVASGSVSGINVSPDAVDDEALLNEDAGATTIDVLANDTDVNPDDVLMITLVSRPESGSVVNGDTYVTYTPPAGWFGTDTFEYVISDGNQGVDTATVTVIVLPVNDPPIAAEDSASTAEDTPVAVDVLDNDSDPDTGDVLGIQSVKQGDHGTVTHDGDLVTYTPDDDWFGTDTFTYVVHDFNGGSATADVTVVVSPENDAPIADDDVAETWDNVAVDIDVLANDTDVDAGDNLTITKVMQGTSGSVVISGGGVTYTPGDGWTGDDTFEYTIADAAGLESSAQVTVSVNFQNDPPVATADAAIAEYNSSVSIAVLDNDTDPDVGDTISLTDPGSPAHGTAVIQNGEILYTPHTDWFGSDSLTYTIEDSGGLSASATVDITVLPAEPEQDLLVSADSVEFAEGSSGNFSVQLAIQPEATVTVTLAIATTDGAAAELDKTQLTFSPDNWNTPQVVTVSGADDGSGVISIHGEDSQGGTWDDTVSVTVSNVSPTITSVLGDTSPKVGQAAGFSAFAADAGDDSLFYTWNFGDGSGDYVGQHVTHEFVQEGTYTVSLQVSDGEGGSDTDTLSVQASIDIPPEVTVLLGSQEIADGSQVVVDFGSVLEGGNGPLRTFTVRNDGGNVLNLGTLALPDGFRVVGGGLVSSLQPGQSDLFNVLFESDSPGVYGGDITLISNDADESPYSFSIRGEVIALEVNDWQGVKIGDGGAKRLMYTDFDGSLVTVSLRGDGSAMVNFTLEEMLPLEQLLPDRRGKVDLTGFALEVGQIMLDGTGAKTTLSVRSKGGKEAGTDIGCIVSDDTNGVIDSLRAISGRGINVVGDIEIEGLVRTIMLGDVLGGDIRLNTLGAPTTDRDCVRITLGSVVDCSVESNGIGITSLLAAEWLDVDSSVEVITAPWIGKLSTKVRKANRRRGLVASTGEFAADINITGNRKGQAIGRISIGGDILGSEILALKGSVGRVSAVRWDGGLLNTRWVSSLITKGNRKAGTSGDLAVSLTLSGEGASRGRALSNAKVSGVLGNSTWNIEGDIGRVKAASIASGWSLNASGAAKSISSRGDFCGVVNLGGDLGKLTVTGDFTGTVHAQSAKSVRVRGSMIGAELGVLQERIPGSRTKALGSLSVTGQVDGSRIFSRGDISRVTVGAIRNSCVFAGTFSDTYQADVQGIDGQADSVLDLPELKDVETGAGEIGTFIVTGRTLFGEFAMLNSNVAASYIKTIRITGLQPANSGVPFGIAASSVRRLTLKEFDTPTPDGDWVLRLGQFLV